MACLQFGTKPLSEPMLANCQLEHWEQIQLKFSSNATVLVQGCWFENVICQMTTILSRPIISINTSLFVGPYSTMSPVCMVGDFLSVGRNFQMLGKYFEYNLLQLCVDFFSAKNKQSSGQGILKLFDFLICELIKSKLSTATFFQGSFWVWAQPMREGVT